MLQQRGMVHACDFGLVLLCVSLLGAYANSFVVDRCGR